MTQKIYEVDVTLCGASITLSCSKDPSSLSQKELSDWVKKELKEAIDDPSELCIDGFETNG